MEVKFCFYLNTLVSFSQNRTTTQICSSTLFDYTVKDIPCNTIIYKACDRYRDSIDIKSLVYFKLLQITD